jgi:hypothetical protein
MSYQALIVEYALSARIRQVLNPLDNAGRVFHWREDGAEDTLLAWLEAKAIQDFQVSPEAPGLRVRQVVKDRQHFFILFNEQTAAMDIKMGLSIKGQWLEYDAITGQNKPLPDDGQVHLDGYELKILISLPMIY